MPDNFSYSITCGPFEESLSVAFSSYKTAWGYYSDEKEFVLFWAETSQGVPFPTPLKKEEVGPLIKSWLSGKASYGRRPDLDGDAEKSWRFEVNEWGQVEGYGWESFLKVTPVWALSGK